MDDLNQPKKSCCSGDDCASSSEDRSGLQPLFVSTPSDEACCGSAPGPQSSSYEKPGYKLLHFVEEFIDTPIGPIPRVNPFGANRYFGHPGRAPGYRKKSV